MKSIAIFPNEERDVDLKVTRQVAAVLNGHGKRVIFDEKYRDRIPEKAEFMSKGEALGEADLIVALGGDGTILKIAADAAEYDIPMMGINLGHLGFLAQAERGETSVFEKIFKGEYTLSKHTMIEARLMREGEVLEKYTALNDVILKGRASKMVALDVAVDGISTTKCLADGMIVATATGSTAYSLSSGGPIVHPGLDCMLITPICPHTLKSRCIVVPSDKTVTERIDTSYKSEVLLKIDSNSVHVMEDGEYIEVVKSEKCATFINLNGRNYFDVVRKKLAD